MVTLPDFMQSPPEPYREPVPFEPSDASDAELIDLLHCIDSAVGHDDWKEALGAFFTATAGAAWALDAADSWSSTANNYTGRRSVEAWWRQFSDPSGDTRQLGALAKRHGGDPGEIARRHRGHSEPSDAQRREWAEAAARLVSVGGVRVDQFRTSAPDPMRSTKKRAEPYPIAWFADIETDIFKEWVIEDWMGQGELLMPYGRPGSGKSVAVTDLAGHLGAGWPWFGKQVQQSVVLYVAAERAGLVLRRLAAFRKHHKIDEIPVGVISGYFDMAKSRRDTDRIIATGQSMMEVTGLRSLVTIIDTKRQVIDDENSSDVPALVGNIARIQSETGSAVIVIDHTPFHSPTKPAGNGALLSAADTTALVESVGALKTMTVKKVNDGDERELTISFTLESVDLGTNPRTGKVTTAPVVVAADKPEPDQKNSGHLTAGEKIAIKALEEAIIEVGEKSVSSHIPPDALTVSVELWRDYAYKRGISDADSPEARKKAFQRARKSLIEKGRIATWNDRIWLVRASGETASALILKSLSGHGT